AAALALRRIGRPFEVLDVGYDLEPKREAEIQSLAATSPSEWNRSTVERMFPAPMTSSAGVAKRYIFGSDFPYRRPEQLDLTIDMSHGLGGFGNVWGAAILPYAAHDLSDWPHVVTADLSESYRNISEFVPFSAEVDDLQESFPIFRSTASLHRSEQTENLLGA